ncbi:MAG: hypothetical protein AAFR01_13980, partial [Pseudomonadota bacterium]
TYRKKSADALKLLRHAVETVRLKHGHAQVPRTLRTSAQIFTQALDARHATEMIETFGGGILRKQLLRSGPEFLLNNLISLG